jgi:type IV fimbrial biogenesis protein FimT
LNHARSEAIKRNTRVLMCVRNLAGTGCGTGTNWQNGWVVCTDADGNDVCDDSTASNPNPVIVRPALDAALTLAGSAASVRFNANSSQGGGSTTATLSLGGTWSGATSRVVSVAGTGYISKQ